MSWRLRQMNNDSEICPKCGSHNIEEYDDGVYVCGECEFAWEYEDA
jgi:ribosomal protein L37AE/L43A